MGFVGVKYEDPRLVVKEMWEDNIVFLGGPAVKERISLEELIKLPFLFREETSSQILFNSPKKFLTAGLCGLSLL